MARAQAWVTSTGPTLTCDALLSICRGVVFDGSERIDPLVEPLQIEKLTGFETRVTILGHIQRGGTPTAFDRVLATRFGIRAIEAVHDGAFGQMVALQAAKIVRVALADAVGELKTVDRDLYHGVAEVFFG